MMKNIQVIDGAENCAYSIFQSSEEDFSLIFSEKNQDVEFIEDVITRIPENILSTLMDRIWRNPVKKSDVCGIHGTLFYQLYHKKIYYPSKIEAEMVTGF